MNSPTSRPRNAWIAVLLCLLSGGPLGYAYAGRIGRGIVIWILSLVALPLLAASVVLPVGGLLVVLGFLCLIGFPIFTAIDTYRIVKQNQMAPLRRYQRWWVYAGFLVVLAIANQGVAFMIKTSIAEAFFIPTRSMSPTIRPGDRIIVDKLAITADQLRRNDIITFHSAGPSSALFVMRLIGLPGDRIEIINEKVWLNGREWPDAHAYFDADFSSDPSLTNMASIEVPRDAVFVLGDNRRLSNDSRLLGTIPLADIRGKARLIYWSQERVFPNPWEPTQFETRPTNWSRIGTRLDATSGDVK